MSDFLVLLSIERASIDTQICNLTKRRVAIDALLRTYGSEPEAATDAAPARAMVPAHGGRAAAVLAAITGLHAERVTARRSTIAEKAGVPVEAMAGILDGLRANGSIRREGVRGAARYVPASEVTTIMPQTPEPMRRFTQHGLIKPDRVTGLPAGHSAIRERRTLFPSTVVDVADSPRVLVSGANSRKIGDRIVKGDWAGMPTFILTLEERATCPASCHHFSSCYGNGMPLARRHRHGPELIARLDVEMTALNEKHPRGFAVRLHQLGDFWSVEYVDQWLVWLEKFQALHVWGYTAWAPETPIGAAVKQLRDELWSRFAIRFSSAGSTTGGATTIWREPEEARVPEGIVCPAQTDKSACCGTCGLCWSGAAKDETIVFIAHGQHFKNGDQEAAAVPGDAEMAAA